MTPKEFTQYQRDCLRTCKVMDANIYNSIHMILGITSEYFEVLEAERLVRLPGQSINEQIEATKNLEKELGDVLWYTALLAYFNKLDFSRGFDFKKRNINDTIGNLNSIFKAAWIYDRSMIAPDKTGIPPIDQVQDAIYNIIYWIETSFYFPIESIAQKNIEKLQTRFPEEFAAELANNRKTEDN